MGKVDDLLIDPEQQKVRLLRVEHGGLFVSVSRRCTSRQRPSTAERGMKSSSAGLACRSPVLPVMTPT
uniref:hypothetical protein n=1 Tax=Paractinoplanes polyasparticus TaxID=2856853 RepID=UPI0034DAFDCF